MYFFMYKIIINILQHHREFFSEIFNRYITPVCVTLPASQTLGVMCAALRCWPCPAGRLLSLEWALMAGEGGGTIHLVSLILLD